MAKIPNLYQILGLKQSVCQDPDCDEKIRKAYYERAKISHPDKNKDRADAKQLFELLTCAYDVLKDPESREKYNQKLKAKSAKDHSGLKHGFDKYAKTMPVPTDALPPAKEFLLSTEETQSTAERLEQLKTIRAQQDAFKPKRIIDGDFKPELFNAFCDRYEQMNEKKPASQVPRAWGSESSLFSIIEMETPKQAASMGDTSLFGSFIREQDSYEDIDLSTLQPVDYYASHAVKTDSYLGDIKRKLQERQRLTDEIQRNTNPSNLESPYDTTINEVAALAMDDELEEIDKRLAKLKGNLQINSD